MKISKIFTDLFNKIYEIEESNTTPRVKKRNIDKEVVKVYKNIKDENRKDVEILVDNTIRHVRLDIEKKRGMRYKGQHSLGGRKLTEQEVNRQKEARKALKKIQLQQRQKEKIINQKVAGKNTNQRLDRNQRKLKKDINKLKKEKKTLLKRFSQEARRTRNLFKNENHRLKERVKNFAFNLAENLGFEFNRVWHCVFRNSRDAHKEMHLQKADKDGYFHSGGYKTKYPKGFGIARLDCNCQCYVTVERKEKNEV